MFSGLLFLVMIAAVPQQSLNIARLLYFVFWNDIVPSQGFVLCAGWFVGTEDQVDDPI